MNVDLRVSYDDLTSVQKLQKCFLHNQKIHEIFFFGCGYAMKYLNQITYRNLGNDFDRSEAVSLVYFALHYCLNKYHWSEDPIGENFKNFFYLVIRYRCIYELKEKNNWKQALAIRELIKNPRRLRKTLVTDFIDHSDSPFDERIILIKEFLRKKKKIYLDIVNDRLSGLTYKAIAEKHQTTEQIIKAKFRYIRKLIRIEFKLLNVNQ